MNSAELAKLHHRITAAIRGEALQREAGSGSPVARYLDPARHTAELALLRRWPVAVAPSADLAAPGAWSAVSAHGVPVLLARGADGQLRAFLNVCRHRGAALVAEGSCGQGRERFVCPYHSWTYAPDGRCVGRPHEADFAHAPRDGMRLVVLPCTERLGLVWVRPTPMSRDESAFDWNSYFGPFADELAGLGYDAATVAPHRRRFEQPSNWKLVLDANLESYHFRYAHRATIAEFFHDNLVVHDRSGPHHRIVLPKRGFADLAEPQPTLSAYARQLNIIYFFFPATALLWEGDHVNGFTVSPLRPEACVTDGWLLVPVAQHATRSAEHWRRNFEIFWTAIDEDFALAASMQRGLASGANTALCFGTNEFACTQFHTTLEAELARAAMPILSADRTKC